jgi:lysophospholipase L1-like esterase
MVNRNCIFLLVLLLSACGHSTQTNAPTTAPTVRAVTNIVCLGDSITFGHRLAREDAYPQQLEALLNQTHPEREWHVVNAGISGNTTRQMLARFATDVVSVSPQYVIILGGLNDLWYGYDQASNDPSFRIDSPGGMKDNMRALIADARAYGITPIVVTAPPNGGIEDTIYDNERAAMVAFRQWERDTFNAIDLYGAIESPDRQWYPVPADTIDNLHLSAEGSSVLAKLVADAITLRN